MHLLIMLAEHVMADFPDCVIQAAQGIGDAPHSHAGRFTAQ